MAQSFDYESAAHGPDDGQSEASPLERLAEIATALPEPEEWLHAQGWQLGEQVNERVLAALKAAGAKKEG